MRVLASKGCVAATATMARESGKFSGSTTEGGWPEVGRNELVVVGGEWAAGEEATFAVSVPALAATRKRWRRHVEVRPVVVGAELWWAGRPRGRKSGGGGWSEKLPESRPAAATVADSKKAEEKKWGKNGKKKGERLRDD